jgi:hypothetical protein
MLRVKYYDNIAEMPIHNYFKLNETNEIKWLVEKKGIYGNTKEAIEKAITEIQQQIIDEFGIGESYAEILQLKQEIAMYKCDNAIEGTNFYNTFVNIKETELKALEEQKGTTKEEMQLHLTKFIGVKLNYKETSVKEYYTYIKKLNENNSKQPD